MKTIGERIKKLRTEHSMKITEFCIHCDLSYDTVYFLESGKTTKPKFKTINKIAKSFNISTDWILYGKGKLFHDSINPVFFHVTKHLEALNHDKVYLQYKDSNELHEKRLDRLYQILEHLIKTQQC